MPYAGSFLFTNPRIMRILYSTLFLLCSFALSAQVTTTGFFGNLALGAASVSYDEDGFDESAGGLGLDLRLGYGITPTTTLYLGFGGYNIGGNDETLFVDDYGFGTAELGARFHIGRKVNPLVFYVDVAAQAISAEPYEGVELNGGGLSVAPGLLYFVADKVALDAQLRYSGGNIGEIGFDNVDIDVSDEGFNYGFARLNIGVSVFL